MENGKADRVSWPLGLAQSNNSNRKIINTDNQWDIISHIDIGESFAFLINLLFVICLKDDAGWLGTKELLIDNYDFYLNQIIADWSLAKPGLTTKNVTVLKINQIQREPAPFHPQGAGCQDVLSLSLFITADTLDVSRPHPCPLSSPVVWCWPRVSPLLTVLTPGKLVLAWPGVTALWPAGARCLVRLRRTQGESQADLVTSRAKIPDYRDLNVFVLHSLFRLYLFGEGKCNLWKMDYQDNIVRLPLFSPPSATFPSTK